MINKKRYTVRFTLIESARTGKLKAYLKGFTLVEILVVIAIIGILATVVTVNVMGASAKSRNAKRASDISEISNAVHLYYISNNTPRLPANVAVPVGSATSRWCMIGKSEDLAGAYSGPCLQELVTGGYLPQLPQNAVCNAGGLSLAMGSYCYGYFDYGSYVTIGTQMEPANNTFGPFPYGWNCSTVVATGATLLGGWWDGMDPVGTYKEYCAGFVK